MVHAPDIIDQGRWVYEYGKGVRKDRVVTATVGSLVNSVDGGFYMMTGWYHVS